MEKHEDDISRKKEAAFSNLQLMHPIMYKSYNLCMLATNGKLALKFRIAEWKNICSSLDIDTDNFKRHKVSHNEA